MAEIPASPGDPHDAGWGPIPDKQAQILKAALQVFRNCGFHEAKVEDIAAAAGVGKGTIYEYFDTKTDLFQQTVKYHLYMFWQLAQQHVQEGSSAGDKIRRVLEAAARLLAEKSAVSYLLVQDPGPMSIDLTKWIWEQRAKIILDTIEDVVRQGIRDGDLRAVDTRVAACFVFMAFHAFLALSVLSPGRLPASMPADVDATLDLIFNGLAR